MGRTVLLAGMAPHVVPSATLGANRASMPIGTLGDTAFDAPRVSTVIFGSQLISEEKND